MSDSVFTDDAIRIEKYYDEFRKKADLKGLDIETRGSITVHINSNRDGNGRHYENWLDYAVQWCASGNTACFLQSSACSVGVHASPALSPACRSPSPKPKSWWY